METVTSLRNTKFFAKQKRVALRNCGIINPELIDEYIALDGYQALGKVLLEMTPEEVIDTVKGVTPGAGKYVTDALTISNGSNKLFVSRLQGVTMGTLYLQYDSDDNIFLYTSSGGLGFYTSLTLTGVIAVPMTTLSPGYVTLDFNDGFIDRYDPYYTDVKN